MAKPRLAQAALGDLRSIRSYSKAVFGTAVAIEYVNTLRTTLKGLGDRPLIGIAEPALGEDMRSFAYRSHRVYYRYDGVSVLIVRILHHAQDAPTRLGRSN